MLAKPYLECLGVCGALPRLPSLLGLGPLAPLLGLALVLGQKLRGAEKANKVTR